MKLICGILFLTLAATSYAQQWAVAPAFSFQASGTGQEDSDYRAGLSALDARQWDRAVRLFSVSAANTRANADAALYWKAYAQNRAGHGEAALSTLAQLRRQYASSRWMRDARALEVEVRGQTGAPVSPNAEADDDLKMLAVNSLMQSNPAAAFPVVEKVLTSDNSERVKEQALFVLTQSGSPEANKVLSDIAGGRANPQLQIKAIQLMGMTGNEEARKALAGIYRSSSDMSVKRAILHSFMQSGARDFLLNAAKSESNPELRKDAIRQLAMTGGAEQLWQLYGSSSSMDDKKAILQSMFMSGDSTRLAQVASTDANPELRTAAIQSLGLMGDNGKGDRLVSIYQNDKDQHVREAVLNALFLQQNGKGLVDLARREKDPEMKKQIISKMALVHSPEVTNYMMEILK
jgi:HEAT repeat protein